MLKLTSTPSNGLIGFIVLSLIVLQGIVGWLMVKSGLVDDVTVSHYRLSVHLTLALIIISSIYWLIRNFKDQNKKKFFDLSKKNFPYLFLILLIFLQIVLGAFVSGLDAGLVHQTWPLMGQSYFPDDVIIKNFLNLSNFENHSLVQFYHRNLAYFITLYISILSFYIYKKEKFLLSPLKILIFFLLFQIILGILTLISGLNIILASVHQISSVILVLTAINLYYFRAK